MPGGSLKFEIPRFDEKGNFGLWWKILLRVRRSGRNWRIYICQSLSSKLYLKQRLYGMKMSEGSDLMQHVHAFNQIVGDLARVGETISLETVAVSLQSHYERRQKTGADGSHGDGLYANNQDKGRHMNKQDGSRTSRSKSKNRAKTTYYLCDVKGHYKRDCPNKGKNKEGKSANVAQRDSDSGNSNQYAVMLGHLADSWVMDTCASFHMTSNREWFETYKEGNMGAVQLVDDRVCSIVGSNSIKFRMHDGVIRTLADVRHVPAVKKNLISLGTLHRNGFRYHAVEGEDVLKV
ncbi:unnamed protein product [Microthlaspi erraticum]|uniref:Retrovirus-related Pol polyprotein from transposon TNT 1-94-like beta-barrel domain-containing protein n=1 Tax=Microthlaspi erraticum TaxID=1685480 RepID=A0A6D2L851_9BRAS|nr:unnamed protein product [Microthlaspi erraticum]